MSEEIQPCPVCKKQTGQPTSRAMWGARGHDAYMCYECGLELPMAVWNTLSEAMQLKRAVDLAEKRSPYITAMHFDWGWNVCLATRLPTTDVVRGEGSTLSAALIALAGEGNE